VRILLPHPHSSLLDSGPRSKLPSVHPPKRTPSHLLLSKDQGQSGYSRELNARFWVGLSP